MPAIGRVSLSPMLNDAGRIIGDFTIPRLAETDFQLTASFSAQAYHMRWFANHLPPDGSVQIENISTSLLGFQIAGP